ncbi:MAG: hypothetical protein INR71_01910 [Terriglobus roseus]|nr:hypothetical protein [Terriglobus roseus]
MAWPVAFKGAASAAWGVARDRILDVDAATCLVCHSSMLRGLGVALVVAARSAQGRLAPLGLAAALGEAWYIAIRDLLCGLPAASHLFD